MKIIPTPMIKITNIAEIVPNKYLESPFLDSLLKLPKATETVVQICSRTLANLSIHGGDARGCKDIMRII